MILVEVNNVQLACIEHNDNLSGIGFFGCITSAGAMYETPSTSGLAHFVEHNLFKGTKSRTARDIWMDSARIGANFNASTSHNHIISYVTFPNENAGKAIEILLDTIFNSVFPEEEIEKEKEIVIAERRGMEDDIMSKFIQQINDEWMPWPIGHSIGGEEDTVNTFTREMVLNYKEFYFNAGNMAFVYVGPLPINQVEDFVKTTMPDNIPWRSPDTFAVDTLWNKNAGSNSR